MWAFSFLFGNYIFYGINSKAHMHRMTAFDPLRSFETLQRGHSLLRTAQAKTSATAVLQYLRQPPLLHNRHH